MFFWRRVAPQSPEDGLKPTATPSYLRNFREINQKIAAGKSFSGYERNATFLNLKGHGFADVGVLCGTDYDDDARAVASLDWDHDGDQDIWVTNRTAPRVRLLQNNHPATNGHLTIRLVGNGTTTNRDAIGARVTLSNSSGDQLKQIRTLRAGDGFLAQSTAWLHFGLGKSTDRQQLTVAWPGGKTETFDNLIPNSRYEIEQGQEPRQVTSSPPPRLARTTEQILPTESANSGVWIANPVPFPQLDYSDENGARHSTVEFRGKPVLVNLWATWCVPCIEELSQFAKRKEELAALNATILALNVDGLAETEQGAAPEINTNSVLQRVGYDLPHGIARRETLGKTEVLIEFLSSRRTSVSIPSSFLVDAKGNIAAVYFGVVPWDRLVSDLSLLNASSETRLERVAPRGGHWFFDPRQVDLAAHLGDLATSYARNGFPEESESIYQLIKPQEGIQQARTFFNQARTAAQQGHREQAKKYYREALRLDPEFGQALTGLGTLMLAENHVAEAQKLFEQALRIDPNHATALVNLATIDRSRGNNDQAIERLQRVISRNPDFVEAHLNLGSLLASIKRHDEAIEHLSKAITLDPKSEVAYINLAGVYTETNQFDKAEEHYRRVQELNPRLPFAHFGLGMLLAKQHRHTDAAASFRKAIALGGASPRVYTQLGLSLVGAGDRAGAAEAFRNALKLDPRHAGAQRAMQEHGLSNE